MATAEHNSDSSSSRTILRRVFATVVVLLAVSFAGFLALRIMSRFEVLDLAKYSHTNNLPEKVESTPTDEPSATELLIDEIGVAFTVPGDWERTNTPLIDYWVYEAKDQSLRALLWYPDGGPKGLHSDVVSQSHITPESALQVMLMREAEYVEYEKRLRLKVESTFNTGRMYCLGNDRIEAIVREAPADSRVEISLQASSGREANVLLVRTDGGNPPVSKALGLARSFRFLP